MNDTPKHPDQVVSIHIAVPIERVWAEITKTGGIQRALYNTVLDCRLEPGSKLRYYSPNRQRVFIIGEVVEVEPPHRLSHTYQFTTTMEPPTLVTWELAAEDGGCRVTVSHSGWTAAHTKPEKTAAGWKEILGLLKQELETGDLPWKTKALYRVMGWFLFLMPKTTKTSYLDEQGL